MLFSIANYASLRSARSGTLRVSRFRIPVGGVPDLVEDGETGCLAQEDTTESLGNALLRFAEMPMEWPRISGAARSWAEAHLHWDQIVERYESFYEQVLASR